MIIENLDSRLTPERMRLPQIIYGAIAFSVMTLLVVLLFFYAMAGDGGSVVPGDSMVGVLTIVTFVLWGGGVVAGSIIYNSFFKPGRVERYLATPIRENDRLVDDPAEQAILLVQRAMIVRLVFFDIGAFLGIMTCLVGVTDGILHAQPIYLVNMIPAFFQIAFIGATFPTRERIMGIVREKLGRM